MLITCSKCGKIHKRNGCQAKKYHRKYVKTETYNKIIKSKQWTETSRFVKSLDCFQCLVCCDLNIPLSEYNTLLEVHHIIKINDDETLAFELNNLITLCKLHHRQADDGVLSKHYLKSLINKHRS